MILAQQVTLPIRHHSCIWCNRRFLPNGLKQDTTIDFGPVARTEEHIIPSNIYGAIVTLDLCKACNDTFGSRVDYHLLRDQRVYEAATRAGVRGQDFLKRFRGSQEVTGGRSVGVTFQNGTFRLKPSLAKLTELYVGCTEGGAHHHDLRDLERRLTQKVRDKFKLPTLPQDLRDRITELITAIRKSPDRVHCDAVLQEGFKPTPMSGPIRTEIRSDPWITDWCVTKILYEVTATLIPASFQSFLRPVLDYLRTFVQAGLSAKATGSATTIVQSGEDERPSLEHMVSVTASRHSYNGEVRLFGTASWRFSCEFTPNRLPPEHGFRVEMTNPFGRDGMKPSWQVIELSPGARGCECKL